MPQERDIPEGWVQVIEGLMKVGDKTWSGGRFQEWVDVTEDFLDFARNVMGTATVASQHFVVRKETPDESPSTD